MTIASDERDMCVSVVLDNLQVLLQLKEIKEEFERILQLLDFNNKHTIFLEDGMLMEEYSITKLLIHKILEKVFNNFVI